MGEKAEVADALCTSKLILRKIKTLEEKIAKGQATVSMFKEYLSLKRTRVNFDNYGQESFYSVFGDKNKAERSDRMKSLDQFVQSKRVFKKRD